MKQMIEKEVNLPKVSIHLGTIEWNEVEEVMPCPSSYSICQRLSSGREPLRIENINTSTAFPRERSVGFLPPNCPVRLIPFDGPFKMLNCSFDRTYFETATDIRNEDWEEYTGALVAIRDRRLEVFMQEILSEILRPGFGHEMLIESVSNLILVEMARYSRRLRSRSGHRSSNQALAPWHLRRIQERIDASLEMGYPSLEELAALIGFSQSHLMRSFKLSTGWPVHKFVAQERLSAAKRLLAEHEMSSKEIAVKLGFRSPAYFATAFRRMTGKTPSAFRADCRTNPVERSRARTLLS